MFSTAKKLFEVYAPFRLAMLGTLGFILLSQVLALIEPYIQGKVVDALVGSVGSKAPQTGLLGLVGAVLVVSILRVCIVQYLRDMYEIKRLDFAIPTHVQSFTLARLFSFSIGQHTNENSGIKQSVINRGENASTNLVYMALYQVLPIVAEASVLTCVLLYWSPIIGGITLLGMSAFVLFAVVVNTKYRSRLKSLEKLYVKDGKFQGEVIRHAPLVLSLAQENRAIRECGESRKKADSVAMEVWSSFFRLTIIRNAIMPLTRAAIWATGIYLVVSGRHSIGELTMLLSWSTNALGGISSVSMMHREIMRKWTSIKKFFDMLEIEPEVKVVPNPVKPERFAGEIEFKNVTFRYKRRETVSDADDEEEDDEEAAPSKDEGSEPALDNVSFRIPAGQTVGIVGESGAGKSTLVSALLRAQDPDQGQIVIDGNDLRVLDLAHYRTKVGLVNQDVALFDHTLRYNITYGLSDERRNVGDPVLDQFATIARVDSFFDKLEKGYDTLIGERGVKLSGGERQRVGIARALIKKPDILIFDEATSNLDAKNETLIRESLRCWRDGRTTIIVAHRFSTIRYADRILVLDKGKIVGDGTHEGLVDSCEEYRRLVESQMAPVFTADCD